MGLFDKLESKLEQGVNGAFARAFRSEVQPVEVASGIRRAMDDRASSAKKGQRPVVPNLFTIELSETDYDRLASMGRTLDDELIAAAQEHADEQRYLPGGPFTIVLSRADNLETGVFRLRPATAGAADAQAHASAFPRPRYHDAPSADSGRSSDQRQGDDSDAAEEYDDARVGSTGSGRSMGARIKDYLRGGYVTDLEKRDAPDVRHDGEGVHADEPVNDDDHGHHEARLPQSAVGTTSAADAGSLGSRFQERVHPQEPEPFHPSQHHAWDDDDDDLGDPTGHLRPDATAQFAPPQHPAAPPALSPRQRPWLKIDGQRYPLMSAITVLGRDEDADIIIDDPGVSRRHSEIRITHDGPHLVMSIRDLGSTNGTFVNADPVESQHIYDGDRLTIGRTDMTIHLGDRA